MGMAHDVSIGNLKRKWSGQDPANYYFTPHFAKPYVESLNLWRDEEFERSESLVKRKWNRVGLTNYRKKPGRWAL